jgi:beta-fructofuranosidase
MDIEMTYTIEKANAFIAEHKEQIKDTYRLQYHLMGELGWINDPNGFVQFNGKYHMFYQHYPYASEWGPMHWGHAVSEDLISWEYMPIALAPDMPYDCDGCFSGSAIVKDGKLYLMYTGHILTGPNQEQDYKQVQNIAVSEDGIHFEKIKQNPVISSDQIPEGVSQKDFRDPKMFWHKDAYYTVLGSNDSQGNGLILLYTSPDLISWSFVSVMAKSEGEMGDNWECPDFFSLGEQQLLLFSPQRMPSQGLDYHNLHSTVYMWGEWDKHTGLFHKGGYAPVDQGFDFYAPQTTLDHKGRRIVMAWMDTWNIRIVTQEKQHHWAGALTLPRQMVCTDDGAIYFHPIEEIEQYRGEAHSFSELEFDGEQLLPFTGECYELEAKFDVQHSKTFGLKLRATEQKEYYTELRYDSAFNLFTLNREHSGEGEGGARQTRIELEQGKLNLRIFVDKSSVEVFLQQGAKVLTARIYPPDGARNIMLFSDGTCRLDSLTIWELEI